MPAEVVQLGIAVAVIFLVLQIIQVVLKNNRENDSDNSEVTKALVTLVTSISGNISKNTEVLAELKTFIAGEKDKTRAALDFLNIEIRNQFGHQDKKIDTIIQMIERMQHSLDDTIPIELPPDK